MWCGVRVCNRKREPVTTHLPETADNNNLIRNQPTHRLHMKWTSLQSHTIASLLDISLPIRTSRSPKTKCYTKLNQTRKFTTPRRDWFQPRNPILHCSQRKLIYSRHCADHNNIEIFEINNNKKSENLSKNLPRCSYFLWVLFNNKLVSERGVWNAPTHFFTDNGGLPAYAVGFWPNSCQPITNLSNMSHIMWHF